MIIDQALSLFLLIGGILGLLAAIMAYLIFYNEWMHHYPTKIEPKNMALKAAIFTFVFFLLTAVFAGYFLVRII
jgi:hypothetical protein